MKPSNPPHPAPGLPRDNLAQSEHGDFEESPRRPTGTGDNNVEQQGADRPGGRSET